MELTVLVAQESRRAQFHLLRSGSLKSTVNIYHGPTDLAVPFLNVSNEKINNRFPQIMHV
jgi:hypothetical protein